MICTIQLSGGEIRRLRIRAPAGFWSLTGRRGLEDAASPFAGARILTSNRPPVQNAPRRNPNSRAQMSGLRSDEWAIVTVQQGGNSRRAKASVGASIPTSGPASEPRHHLHNPAQRWGGSKAKDSGSGGVLEPHGSPRSGGYRLALRRSENPYFEPTACSECAQAKPEQPAQMSGLRSDEWAIVTVQQGGNSRRAKVRNAGHRFLCFRSSGDRAR
jgi:hypothetical protein